MFFSIFSLLFRCAQFVFIFVVIRWFFGRIVVLSGLYCLCYSGPRMVYFVLVYCGLIGLVSLVCGCVVWFLTGLLFV